MRAQLHAPPWLVQNHRLLFLAGLYVAVLVALHGAGAMVDDSPARLLLRLGVPLLELGLCFSFCGWLDRRWAGRRVLAANLLLTALVGLIYTAQIYALFLSGNFITVLALQNHAESRIVEQRSLYLTLLAALLWWMTSAALYLRKPHVRQRAMSRHWAGATLLLGLLQGCLLPWQGSSSRLEAGYLQAPIGALANNSYQLLRSRAEFPAWRTRGGGDAPYPLEKRDVYTQPLPFPDTGVDARVKNVIVIFSEGTSTRLIGAYGSKYPGLTPNIDRLAAHSMRVIHYYNHTAATYRGLQGQLVSGYPWAGGAGDTEAWADPTKRDAMLAIRNRSVPMILNQLGYHTEFLSPHHDTVGLNTMLRALGFEKVYSFDDVSRRIAPGNPMYAVEGALSDGELFHALNLLMATHRLSKPGQPFFAGLYNFGTHAFLDVVAFGLKYGDGSNPALNRLHNYDHAVGAFLDAFLASDYAHDTIVVFTADHANYPEPSYREAVGENHAPYFVDQIPLLIYDPFHRLPATWDAHGRTSIDFAPTLLQLLGVRHADNSFLGTSLFEDNHRPIGIAAIGNEFYATDTLGVFPEGSVPAALRAPFAAGRAAVIRYYRLEQANRLFRSPR